VHHHNLLGSGPFVSRLDRELDSVASPQPIGIHPVAEVVHMYEHIRPPIITSDKTVPLLMIEPLDVPCYSIRHFASSPYLIRIALLARTFLYFDSRLLMG
jgi:hypothetical protein